MYSCGGIRYFCLKMVRRVGDDEYLGGPRPVILPKGTHLGQENYSTKVFCK